MDSYTTAIGLLPAGVICLLIPKCGKVGISIILFLSLLGIFLRGWLCSLLCLWVMNRGFMVWSIMMNGLVMNRVVMKFFVHIVVDIVFFQVFWMVSIDNMILSVFCLVGFMDSLWVHMMVVIVVEIMMIVKVMVVVMIIIVMGVTVVESIYLMVATIEAINEWIVV